MKVTRKTYRGIKVLVLTLALALVVTAVPLGVFLNAPKVIAANVSNFNDLRSTIENASSGSTVEVTFTGNTSADFTDPIDVRANTRVTVINNGTITVTANPSWSNVRGRMFTVANGATLNLQGSGTYKVQYNRTGKNVESRYHEIMTSNIHVVENNGGTVNLMSGTLVAENKHEYDGVNGATKYGNGSVFVWGTGIWNRNGTVNITGGSIDVDVSGACVSSSDDNFGQENNSCQGGMRCYVYGYGVFDDRSDIAGNTVTMNGGSIDVFTSSWYKYAGRETRRAVAGSAISYGIMSDNAYMINGSITTRNNHGTNKNNTCGQWTSYGTMSSWSAGIAYKSGKPIVDGGTIATSLTNSDAVDAWNDGERFSKKNYAIMATPSASCVSYSPSNYYTSVTSQKNGNYPMATVGKEHRWKASSEGSRTETNSRYLAARGNYSGEPTAGVAKDINGRERTWDNANMAKGNLGDSASSLKTMYIFRYYDVNGNLSDYGYAPRADILPSTTINASGSSNHIHYFCDSIVMGTGGAMQYARGFIPSNTYKWEMRKISYTQKTYSDTQSVSLDALARAGDVYTTLTTFSYPGAAHTAQKDTDKTVNTGWVAGNYVYAFIDYYQNAPEELSLSYLPNLSLEYTGVAKTAADCGVAIKGTRNTTQTTDDDILFDASTNHVTPTVSYTGTSSGSGYPKNAGSYTVRVQLGANDATNRKALDASFSLTITKRGNPDFAEAVAAITYPQSLGNIDLAAKAVPALAAYKNDFTFAWEVGADYKPTVAQSDNYRVICTPKDEAKGNYTQASYAFNVNVTVNPLPVTVGFPAASIKYGEELDLSRFVSVSANGGLAADLKTELLNTIKNDVKIFGSNGIASSYVPGTTHAGTYTRWGFEQTAAFNKGNFAVSLGETNRSFTVNPVGLTVTVNAHAAEFPYRRGVTGETVSTYKIEDVAGILDQFDSLNADVILGPVDVLYPNGGNAGSGALTIVDNAKPALSGSKGDCYTIETVIGGNVTITKAEVPADHYAVPTLPTLTYDPLVNLNSIAAAYSMSDAKGGGSFAPKDGAVVPTAGTRNYAFIYTPNATDQQNYNTTKVEIPITVEKRVITVSAAPVSVEYGDLALDAADYEWTFSGWTAGANAATDGSAFPVLQSSNGKIVAVGDSENALGMGNAWNTMMLTSAYTPTTNAGTPISITVNGPFDMTAANYEFRFEAGELSVSKRHLDIIVPDVTAVYGAMPTANTADIIYGSDEHDFANNEDAATVFAGNPASFVFGIASGDTIKEYVPGTDEVGTYQVFVRFANENLTNYSLHVIPGTLTVQKKTVTLLPRDVTITYGDSAPGQYAFEYYTEDAVDLSVVIGNSPIKTEVNYTQGDKVGNYTIKAVCNQDGTYTDEQQVALSVNENYTVVFGNSATLTVEKASLVPTQIDVPPLEIVYSETKSLNEQLKAYGNNSLEINWRSGAGNMIKVTGEISYENGNGFPQVSETGYFEVNFTPTGESADNFNEVNAGLSGYVQIVKASVTGNLQIGGQLMAGGAIYPVTAGLNPGAIDCYNFAWYFVAADGSETLVGTNRSLILTNNDEGKTVKLVATLDESINGNYIGSAEFVSDVQVSPPLTIIQPDWIVTSFTSPAAYDGNAHPATVTAGNFPADTPYNGRFTVKYNGETAAPVDAGTYYVTVDCTSDEHYAATTAIQVGVIIIQPAKLTLSFSAQDKTYDAGTKATLVADSVAIASGLIASDADQVGLNTNNAKAEFDSASAGENKSVTLSNVYLTGARASNYTLTVSTATANIEKARVTATAKLKVPAADYSPALADENTSGVYVYFSNIAGVMSRDKSGFRIAEDAVAIPAPRGGESCAIDMATISAVPNNDSYYVVVDNADPLYVLVNKIVPETAATLAAETLTLASRVYDSRATLTDEELRTFIAGLQSGAYAADAKYYSWVRTDGATPVPQVSTTATPRTYYVVFDNQDPNYKTVTFKVRVPVSKREVVLQASGFEINYGDENPLDLVEHKYIVLNGLYADESVLDVFKAEPTVRTNYLRYSDVGEYEVTVNATNLRNNNYSLVIKNGMIKVSPIEVRATATAATKTYDGVSDNIVVSFSDLIGKAREDDDVYLPAYVYGSVADATAGSNKLVTITAPALEGSAAVNYVLRITNMNRIFATIEKIAPEGYRFPISASIIFGEMLSSAELDGTEFGDGTFFYEMSNEIPAAVGVYQNTYDMVFQPADSNYRTVKQKVTLDVKVCQLNIVPVISGSIYIGNTLTAEVPGIPVSAKSYAHFAWFRVDPNTGSETRVGTDSATYTLTSADVDSQIKVVVSFSSDDPYQGTGDAISAVIKEESLTFWQKIWKWWYSILAAIKRLFRMG